MGRLSFGLVAILGIGLLSGCKSDAELSKADDKQLRGNFSRALTAEEVAQMGTNTKGAAPPEGAPQ